MQDGKQGSRPGSTRAERMAQARAGKFKGPQYEKDRASHGVPSGSVRATDVGQSRVMPRTTPISTRMTGNSPYERQYPQKPGNQ